MNFKRVPAIDKCFQILEFFVREKEPMGISRISDELNLNKSTVFNIVHTLSDLNVLENMDNQFRFGTKLYVLGKAAEQGSDLIRNIHPYLKVISITTGLTSFLGMRSGFDAVIIDKSDSSYELKMSAEIGTRIPLVAGAHGKAFLSQLTDEEREEIVSHERSGKFIKKASKSKQAFIDAVKQVVSDGYAYEDEEYIEGVRALAIPLNINRSGIQCAIWAVGLKSQIKDSSLQDYIDLLLEVSSKIESKL